MIRSSCLGLLLGVDLLRLLHFRNRRLNLVLGSTAEAFVEGSSVVGEQATIVALVELGKDAASAGSCVALAIATVPSMAVVASTRATVATAVAAIATSVAVATIATVTAIASVATIATVAAIATRGRSSAVATTVASVAATIASIAPSWLVV